MARDRSERGAVLVQVAIAILVLTAMATFVVDHGVLWVSRGQAQNAADAGALSGAIARAYDELTDPPASNGKAFMSAMGAALANNVWTSRTHRAGLVGLPRRGRRLVRTCRCVPQRRVRQHAVADHLREAVEHSVPGRESDCHRRVASGNASATACGRSRLPTMDRTTTPRRTSSTIGEAGRMTSTPHRMTTCRRRLQFRIAVSELPQDIRPAVTLKTETQLEQRQRSTPGWSLPVRLPDGLGGYVSGATTIEMPSRTASVIRVEYRRVPADGERSDDRADEAGRRRPRCDRTLAPRGIRHKRIAGSCAPVCADQSANRPDRRLRHRRLPMAHAMDDWTPAWNEFPRTRAPTGGKCIRVVNILGFFVERMSGK